MQSVSGLSPLFLAYVLTFALAAVACFASVPRARNLDDSDTQRGLVWLLVLSGTWALTHVAFLLVPGTGLKLLAYYAGLVVGLAAVGPWLYFCSAYTGRSLHRVPIYRRVAVAVFLGVVAVKLTNPIHGLYFTTTMTTTPFPHLSVEYQLLHWLAMGLAYSLSTVGVFMLVELFTQTDSDTRPFLVLLGLFGLPLALDVAGLVVPWLIGVTYEPLGVAAFAVGTLFLFSERFRRVRFAGTIDDPIVFFDEAGDVRDVNEAARQLFPALDGAVGEPFAAVLPEVAAHVDDEEGQILELERDGETRYYMVSMNPFRFGRTRAGRMVIVTDVTRTEQYRREMERQNERLSRVASVISHDLRNPLNVAQGRVEMEQERRDSDNLEAAERALSRMERIIEDVLTLAREGQDVGEQEPVTLSVVARAAADHVAAPAATLEVAEDGAFRADPTRFQQLFENLLRNAVEHVGENVTVRVGMLPGGDGFFVEDDGPGIPPDERDAVFEFGHTSNAEGSGLGLTIARTIAEGHDWDVSITDGDLGGARFEFRGVERVDDQTP